MLPTTPKDILHTTKVVTEENRPTLTYRMGEDGRIRGRTDGREAMVQAVYKILNTRRFAQAVYSWNYGTEDSGACGRSETEAEARLRRTVTEALRQDKRITGVGRIAVSYIAPDCLVADVEVQTVFGTVYGRVEGRT